jgi:hypothetical protein
LLEKVKIPCIPNQASNSAHEKAFRPYKANTKDSMVPPFFKAYKAYKETSKTKFDP